MELDDIPDFRDKLAAFKAAGEALLAAEAALRMDGITGLGTYDEGYVQRSVFAAQRAQDAWRSGSIGPAPEQQNG
jgi:hypothetical protein